MSKSTLEEPRPTVTLRGILQGFLVSAVELTYKTPGAKPGNEVLYRHVELRIEVVEVGRPWQMSPLPPVEPAGLVTLMRGNPSQKLPSSGDQQTGSRRAGAVNRD